MNLPGQKLSIYNQELFALVSVFYNFYLSELQDTLVKGLTKSNLCLWQRKGVVSTLLAARRKAENVEEKVPCGAAREKTKQKPPHIQGISHEAVSG